MTAQDQNCRTSNCISSNMGVPSARKDEQAIKVRKPYTITKQRERWTEEEHRKFLDALKLHGRAWRRIEEHVGSKTAVQIRSHAQKFFSKVERESNGDDAKSVKPIEIPPPRPKRKPMHPYPRKLVITPFSVPEKPTRSVSPNLSLSEKENQSPTSVLFALDSEGQASADSSPNASPSCVTSATGGSSAGVLLSKHCSMLVEENGSSSPLQVNADPAQVEPPPGKLELLPLDDGYVRESSNAQYLKLFGKTVLVTGSHTLSSPQTGVNDRATTQPFSWNFLPIGDSEYPKTMENTNPVPSLPWVLPCAPAAFPCVQVHSPIPIKARPLFENKDVEEKEDLKEGSSTCSNSGSVNVGICVDKNLDTETQSRQQSFEKIGSDSSSFKPTEIVILEQKAASSTKRTKGFLPYKRCLAERAIHSQTITSEEREKQRTRLCL